MYAPYTTITRRGGANPTKRSRVARCAQGAQKRKKNVGDRTGGAQQQERDARHKKLGGRSKGTTAREKCAVKSTTYEREILHKSTVMKNVRYAQHRVWPDKGAMARLRLRQRALL